MLVVGSAVLNMDCSILSAFSKPVSSAEANGMDIHVHGSALLIIHCSFPSAFSTSVLSAEANGMDFATQLQNTLRNKQFKQPNVQERGKVFAALATMNIKGISNIDSTLL